ncbi:MAG: DUF2190 family protein [Gammaproteobacteria bacterium]|nr:DUF2190 family protein [Gammaproteobacteria bacterium]MCP4881126.1 DUF2190 family protein [Gammaproteobacteria bacterium]
MAKNYIKSGCILTVTAIAAVTSGEPVIVGSLFGIPMTSAAIGEEFELKVDGVWTIAKTTANTPAQFAKAYWNDTAKEVTTTASGNTLVGVFSYAYDGTTSEAEVRLNGNSI